MDKLKFSELLLIGARQVKQVREQYTDSRNGQVHSACAIGMIAIARAGSLNQPDCSSEVQKLRRELRKIEVNKPYRTVRSTNLGQFIIDLNDGNGLSPEKIAAKLEAKGF